MKFSNRILTVPAKAFPLCITVAFTTLPQAEASTWIGGIQSNWFNAANWAPAKVPSFSDVAIIDTGVVQISIGSVADALKLQVGNAGSATFLISNGGRLSTGNGNIGDSAGGWGLVVVSGVDSDGTRALWSNHSDIRVGKLGTGMLAVQDGGKISTENVMVETDESSLSISGIHPDGTRSELHASNMATINSNLNVSDGGLLNSQATEIRGSAIVTGVNVNGISSTLEAESFLGVYGDLQIVDGAVATSKTATVSGGVTVSGISNDGSRSTLTTNFLQTRGGTGGNGLTILDGGLVISETLDARVQTTVSGVSAGGISSSLQVAAMRIRESKQLEITDGGLVEVTNSAVGITSAGEIVVSGVGSGGKNSTLKVNGSIQLREGSLTVRDGGVIEAGGIQSFLGKRATVSFDGGILRSNVSGAYFDNIKSGGIQILEGGVQFDTQLNANTIDQRLEGVGGLVKLGAGTLEITTENAYEGDTIVSEGLLLLNNKTGSATGSGDVRILSNATIGGSGAISGSLINNGTVAPGNSPGTLTIHGDFQQNAGGKLLMEIASQDEFDVLSVGGKVTLGGALEVRNDVSLKYGKFNLIQAEGGITGAFDTIFFTNPQDGRIRSGTDDGNFTLMFAPTAYSDIAVGSNELSLARALNTFIDDTTGDTLTVAENLDQLNAAGYHAAFAAISPALYGAAVATGIEQSQSQSSSLVQFLNSRRLGQSPLGEGGKYWEAWALTTGLYSPGSMSSLDGSEFTSGNFLSGIEHRIDSTFTAGIFASTGDSRGEFAGASLIKQDRFTLGGYATAQRDGYYATTALGGGVLEAHVTRDIEFAGLSREAHSHTDGTEFFSLIAGGYDFRQSNWTFGPTASLQYSKVRYDDVKEKGAGALDLAVGNPEDDSLRSLIGGRVAYHHKASETLTLVPEARVSWQHEFFRNNDTLDASLQQGAGPGFSHQLADSDGDSFAAGLALGFQTVIGFYGNVSYDVEIGRESEVNQTLSVGADWKF